MTEQPQDTAPASDGITVVRHEESPAESEAAGEQPGTVQHGEPVVISPVPTQGADAGATEDPASSAPSQPTASPQPGWLSQSASGTSSVSPESEQPAEVLPTGPQDGESPEPAQGFSEADPTAGAGAGQAPAPSTVLAEQPAGQFVPQHLLGHPLVRLDHALEAVDRFVKEHPELDAALGQALQAALGALERAVL